MHADPGQPPPAEGARDGAACSFFLGRHFSFCLQHGAIEMEPNPLACLFRPFSTDLPPPLLSGMRVIQSCVPCIDVPCIDCPRADI